MNTLHSFSIKKVGLLFAFIFIIIEILSKTIYSFECLEDQKINIYIIVSLSLAVFSKERIDDERTQKVRYFSLKVSYKFLLLEVILNTLTPFNFNVLYLIILALTVYLIVFNLANHFNPTYIFKEKHGKKLEEKIIIIIMSLLAFSFLYDIIA
jgi:hypothetical protein